MKKRLHLSYKTLTLIVLAGAAALLASPISAAAADVEQPTYVEHIAPLLHANCVSCHRPGEIAPMSLRTYDEVRPWARSIGKSVRQRDMPPWDADEGYGPFTNDTSLRIETTAHHQHAVVVEVGLERPAGMSAPLFFLVLQAIDPSPRSHQPLDMRSAPAASKREELLFILWRRHSGERANLRVRQLASAHRLTQERQLAQSMSNPNLLACRAESQAGALVEPVGAGGEANVPAATFVELADQSEEAVIGSLNTSRARRFLHRVFRPGRREAADRGWAKAPRVLVSLPVEPAWRLRRALRWRRLVSTLPIGAIRAPQFLDGGRRLAPPRA